MPRLVRTDEMHHSKPAAHAQHDLDLIAGHAVGDLTDTQRVRAEALLQSCASCAELRRDLVAIASATRSLPPQTAPRDFRLTASQAARLRRGGWLKSLLRPFAAPRSGVRPMAAALTSLGLAGLLVSTVLPSMVLFGSAGAAAPRAASLPAPSAASAGEVPGPLSAAGNPAPSDTSAQYGPASGRTATPAPAGPGGKSNDAASTVPEVAGGGPYGQQASGGREVHDQMTAGEGQLGSNGPEPSPILIGSLVLVALGVALFGLRFVARRTI
jgi:hypothetical protein